MAQLRVFDEDQVHRLLDYETLIERLREGFREPWRTWLQRGSWWSWMVASYFLLVTSYWLPVRGTNNW